MSSKLLSTDVPGTLQFTGSVSVVDKVPDLIKKMTNKIKALGYDVEIRTDEASDWAAMAEGHHFDIYVRHSPAKRKWFGLVTEDSLYQNFWKIGAASENGQFKKYPDFNMRHIAIIDKFFEVWENF